MYYISTKKESAVFLENILGSDQLLVDLEKNLESDFFPTVTLYSVSLLLQLEICCVLS